MSLRYNGEQSYIGFTQRSAAPQATNEYLVYFRSGILWQLAPDGTETPIGSGATLNDITVSSTTATGTPLTIQAPAGAAADLVLVQVKNAAGTVVARIRANGAIECAGIAANL